MLNIRVSARQKEIFTELGGAKWLRETLEEKTMGSIPVTLPGFMSVSGGRPSSLANTRITTIRCTAIAKEQLK